MAEKVTVAIPRADSGEVVNIPDGLVGELKDKFRQLDKVVFGIIVAVVLSSIAIIIAVIGLFLDQMRFNAAAYKEYSDKNDVLIELRDTNRELLHANKQLSSQVVEMQKQAASNQKR